MCSFMCNTDGKSEREGPLEHCDSGLGDVLFFWAAEELSEANNRISSGADRILGADTCDVECLMK